jgi:hypothetical protein
VTSFPRLTLSVTDAPLKGSIDARDAPVTDAQLR